MFTVSKLAKKAGLKPSTIRYYITIGLLKPVKITESNYKIFDMASVEKAKMIKKFRDQRWTIKEIQEYFNEEGSDGIL